MAQLDELREAPPFPWGARELTVLHASLVERDGAARTIAARSAEPLCPCPILLAKSALFGPETYFT